MKIIPNIPWWWLEIGVDEVCPVEIKNLLLLILLLLYPLSNERSVKDPARILHQFCFNNSVVVNIIVIFTKWWKTSCANVVPFCWLLIVALRGLLLQRPTRVFNLSITVPVGVAHLDVDSWSDSESRMFLNFQDTLIW